MNRTLKFFGTAIVLAIASCSITGYTSNTPAGPESENPRRPKLIIGITVDQMRYDYLERFREDFGQGGFLRLMNGGFSANNLHYNYMPTFTGPGHAAIFTGTTPAYNGIVANDWYVRDGNYIQYCAKDTSVRGVGTASVAGQMSPVHLLSTTVGDELRLFSNFRSKVIGISMKDRGAILPAGRMANAAYWYIGGQEDVWATSSWYGMAALPQWVVNFNDRHLGDTYLKSGWSLFRPESTYDESLPDNNQYEGLFKGLIRPVFPYQLDSLRAANGNYDLIKSTPLGNSMTIEFAKAAIEGEELGADEHTDMLCMSFSSTDYVGHMFGIHSREVQDCYLRLDAELEQFLNYLDQRIGAGNYLIFLSADHGGAPTPGYMNKQHAAANYFKSDFLESETEQFLVEKYGPGDWVLNETNQNIFLNRELVRSTGLSLQQVQQEVASFVLSVDGVAQSFTHHHLSGIGSGDVLSSRVRLGFHQRLSGDVIYVLEPGWMEYGLVGTTHGSPWNYDTHVPAIFYGFGIKPGESWKPHTICDIAPTVAGLLHLSFPDACIGQPIQELQR